MRNPSFSAAQSSCFSVHHQPPLLSLTMRVVSKTFRSVKIRNGNPITRSSKPTSSASTAVKAPEAKSNAKSRSGSWVVYLILSTNHPIKTYVGVTTNFPRRLKQHNGELKGGAKTSRAGRPWICACLIQGFVNRSEACEFESKWKAISRKLPRKKKDSDPSKQKLFANQLEVGSFVIPVPSSAVYIERSNGKINNIPTEPQIQIAEATLRAASTGKE